MTKHNPTSSPTASEIADVAPSRPHCTLVYPTHRDPQIQLVLGLEALLHQAECGGAHPEDISFALNYVTNRARPGREPVDGSGEDAKWPDEGEVPAGPYYDYKNDPRRAARAAEGRLDQEGTA